jgi:hypothetical protein
MGSMGLMPTLTQYALPVMGVCASALAAAVANATTTTPQMVFIERFIAILLVERRLKIVAEVEIDRSFLLSRGQQTRDPKHYGIDDRTQNP